MPVGAVAVEFLDVRAKYIRARGLLGLVLSTNIRRRNLIRIFGPRSWLKRAKVLKGLSFRINQGTVHGLLGINGAGKSTALACLSGHLGLDKGSIRVFGQDIEESPEILSGTISKASSRLYVEFTAMEIIGFTARLHQLDVQAATAIGAKLLNELGLTDAQMQKNRIGQLSTGGKAKVALVNALVPLLSARQSDRHPPILLLDEPTHGFDVVAVEAFFQTLDMLKKLIPGLTVVIATNDPREAAYCDDFTAVVSGVATHDEKSFSALKESMQHARTGIKAFADLIGQKIEEKIPAALPELPDAKQVSSSSLTRTFWWRAWRDIRATPWVAFLIVMALIVPNILGLCASSSVNADRGSWAGFVMMTLGIFSSLTMREAYRWLERERSYFFMLETIVSAPIGRLRHFAATVSSGLTIHTVYALTVSLLLLPFLASAPGFADQALHSFAAATPADLIGLFLMAVVFAGTVTAIGLTLSLVPFAVSESFLLLTMVPTILLTLSGVFCNTSVFPTVLRWFAAVNPLTYAAHALSEFLHLGVGSQPALSNFVQLLLPGLGNGWSDICVLAAETFVLFALGFFALSRLEPFLRRIGRFRDN